MLWGACLAQFCYSYPFYLVLTWLPLYLVNSQHLSLGSMAGVTAALYALQATAAVLSGWSSDILIRNGYSPTVVRKGFVIAGMTATGTLFAGAAATSGTTATVLLVASGFTVGLSGTMVFTIGQTLAGPRAGGRWMGFQNMVGNFAGIVAPIVTGIVVDWSGSFAAAFVVAAALSAVGVPLLADNRAENRARRLELSIRRGAARTARASSIALAIDHSRSVRFDPKRTLAVQRY